MRSVAICNPFARVETRTVMLLLPCAAHGRQ